VRAFSGGDGNYEVVRSRSRPSLLVPVLGIPSRPEGIGDKQTKSSDLSNIRHTQNVISCQQNNHRLSRPDPPIGAVMGNGFAVAQLSDISISHGHLRLREVSS